MERSQRTDLDEFYSTVDIKDPMLPDLLAEWQQYYNWDRPHSSLEGTSDGTLMLSAYGWDFKKPIRKLYYNIIITFVSVVTLCVNAHRILTT